MAVFHRQNIDATTRCAIWQIEEPEHFFLEQVPLQQNIYHPHKRLQHLAGRYLLPYLFPDFPHHEIEIADTRKPFLPNEQYHFSISHCTKYAAAIVSSNRRVGVDVEVITPRLIKIQHKFLHANELEFVRSQLPEHQLSILTILWSAKEAMYKWYGFGEVDFSDMMRTFPFTLNDSGEIQAVFEKENFKQNLILHYQLFGDLSLVWVASEVSLI